MLSPIPEHACDYCGLPVRVSLATHTQPASEASPVFCCFGCRLASRLTGAAKGQSSAVVTDSATSASTLGLAIFCAMNVMVFSMFLWSQTERPDHPAARVLVDLSRYILLLLSLPVVVMLLPPLVDDAFAQWQTKSWREGRIATSALLAFGVVAALVYSIVAVIRGSGHVYFEVAVVVLTTTTLGKWLEATGREKTTAALRSLASLLPETVTRITPAGDESIPLAELAAGDRIRVLPGQRIVCDGHIVSGSATLDEQIVTGESTPAAKEEGDKVYSGSLNCDGLLVVQAASRAADGTLARIVDMVQSATAMKSPQQRLADAISGVFVPLVVVLAIIAAILRWGPLSDANESAIARGEAAALAAMSVVVVACPCALSLATPLALWAAVGTAARRQILLRSGDAFATLARAKVICFDKTGTLTTGKPTLVDSHVDPGLLDDPTSWIAMATAATHPLADALREHLRGPKVDAISTVDRLRDLRRHSGRGVEATLSGGRIFLGHPGWVCQQQGKPMREDWTRLLRGHDGPAVAVGFGDGRGGLFLATETVRDETPQAIDALQALGIKIVVLSGDRSVRVESLARSLGIEAHGELLPDDKFRIIERLRDRYGPVAMVGDGMNDAPAIAAADVGIALGCGADVTRETADVCLLGNRLDRIPEAIELARRTVSAMRWNIVWSFSYNAIAMSLAVFGLVHPIIAAIAMAISGLMVIANSLSLANTNPEDTTTQLASAVTT